jgi:predicted branched-subunit amino acid permease
VTTLQNATTADPVAADRATIAGDALRDLRAVSPGIVAFGVFMGLATARMGFGAEAVLGALLVYGGSAQLASLTLLHLGAGLLTALVSGIAVNARLLLYGAVLAPRFRGQPRWFRLLAPAFIQDQTFLSATGRPQYAGADFRRYWWWLSLSILAVWTGSVLGSVLAGRWLPDLPHLVLMGTALFVAMLVPRLVDRRSLTTAATAGAATLVVHLTLPTFAILGGTLAGLAVAVASAPAPEAQR